MNTVFTAKARRAATALGLALSALMAGHATAQAFPTRPITVIFPYTAGSGGDIIARAVSTEAGKLLGQPLVYENRPGANSRLGLTALNNAPGDGHVLNIVSDGVLVSQPIADPDFKMEAGKNYTPISVVFDGPLVLASHPSKPFRDMKGLAEYARANPGKLNFAVAAGAPSHFFAERLNRVMSIDITLIPYKGGAEAATATLAGQTDLVVSQSVKQMVDTGKLIALATTGRERWKVFPETPTLREAGVSFAASVWYPLIAPAGVSKEVAATLNSAFNRAAQSPEVLKKMTDIGLAPVRMSPEEVTAFIKSELDAWGPIIRKAGIKLQ